MAKRLLVLSVAFSLSSLAGCGSNISAPNPRARVVESCRNFGMNDSEIDALISTTEANLDLGSSYGQTIQDVIYGCDLGCYPDQQCAFDCYVCGTAAADYVYGR